VSFLPTKLLGCYERELAPILAVARGFDMFVDVGAGDGYYCVGFKRLFPGTRVIGYEVGRVERSTAAKLAALNGVSVESRGRADHASLTAVVSGRVLLMVDVEGYEYELLDPILVPRLLDATMIVEAHPAVHPAVVDTLRSRFSQSHDVRVIQGSGRDIREFPELADWNEAQARCAISEGRTLNPLWLVLRPRASG